MNYDQTYYYEKLTDHIPDDSHKVAYIDRKFFYETTLQNIITADTEILKQLSDINNFPLLIIESKNLETLLLQKTNIEDQEKVKEFIKTTISNNVTPFIKRINDDEIYFYPTSNNEFIILILKNGILAISKHFNPIKKFIESTDKNSNNREANKQIKKHIEEYSQKKQSYIFIDSDSVEYIMTLEKIKEQMSLRGIIKIKENFTANNLSNIPPIKYDSIKLTKGETNDLIELWINKK